MISLRVITAKNVFGHFCMKMYAEVFKRKRRHIRRFTVVKIKKVNVEA